MYKTVEEVPTWAFGRIFNGDATGLTNEEVEMIDGWMYDWKVVAVSPVLDEDGEARPYFSKYPLFGLPCEVEDCEILYEKEVS